MTIRTALLLALASLTLAAFASPALSSAPAKAHAAGTCSTPRYPGQGYFTSLRVTRVSCATGRKVTLAHYRCRVKHGKRGRCGSVLHYRCTEHRNSIPTEFDSRVTCVNGARKVIYTYQQFT